VDHVELIDWLIMCKCQPQKNTVCFMWQKSQETISTRYAKCYVHMPQTFIKEAQIQLQQNAMSLKTPL